jgi:valyl-tRNA synthetase
MGTQPNGPFALAPVYEPEAVEAHWYPEWERRGYFGARAGSDPPNVTGSLHLGHALTATLQDVLIRWKKMSGFNTLWLPGTDHAGIATQVVVERELAKEGIDARALGREAFVERVWAWKERYGGRIVEQMKALGNSCDWSRLRFTMDEGLAHAVRVAFVRMYQDGLIYRGERIINWCPKDGTALSDSEVEHEDVDGELVTFRYRLVDGSGSIDVATTRIETMLGDTGVAVHPGDDRYTSVVGTLVTHPFDGRSIPIVADEAVDPAFGTGAVKVTPAHDLTDFEIGRRHDLPALNILTAGATISDAAPEEFRGLDRYAARVRVLDRLKELGLVVHVERPYVHSVGHCYRCGTEIEPWLAGLQWFVAVDRLKGPAKQAAMDGRLTFWPERWVHAYTQWMDGLRDWNISRQLWWGHRIPVWYCPNDHQFAAVEDPTTCPTCGSGDLEQDPDVLDTWFSSQLWPFSTLGWPEQTDDLAFFYPTSALVTGYEILYLWVARMVMSGLDLTGDVPFHDVVIHGLVRDAQGKKMSKSLGNVLDPLDAVASYGADALRFGLSYQATDAQNIPFGEEHMDAGRRFANKIWNAARLVLSAGDGPGEGGQADLPAESSWTLSDRWLLSRHQACLEEVDRSMDAYRFADAIRALHRFFWSELCDWGLEAAKIRLYEGSPEQRAAAGDLLSWVLERSLRMLHPFMPFVTEEIWQRFGSGESVMIAPWPEQRSEHRDQDAEVRFGFAEAVVSEVRRFRKAHGLRDQLPLAVRIHGAPVQRGILQELRREIQRLASVSTLEILDEPGDASGCATLVVDGAQMLIPLAGVLDPDVERARLARRIEEVEAEAARRAAKLSAEGFVSKAPLAVVERERERLAGLKEEDASLAAQLDELGPASK